MTLKEAWEREEDLRRQILSIERIDDTAQYEQLLWDHAAVCRLIEELEAVSEV